MSEDPEFRLIRLPIPPRTPTNGAPDPFDVPGWKLLLRGLLGRCPACGGRKLFPRFLVIAPACPTCGYSFERESGWWLGAMTMNIGAAMVLFMAFLIGGLIVTWPDVPWTFLTVAGIALMCIFPVVFMPISRTLWLALEILLNRMG
ncbi:MAG TPA: DUF983 domain-containing protein [Actinomycetota bacterium]|jgi:uncharacterized protein (DUF983 family)